MNEKRLICIFFTFLLLSNILVGIVAAQGANPGEAEDKSDKPFDPYSKFESFLNKNSFFRVLFGILFGMWDLDSLINTQVEWYAWSGSLADITINKIGIVISFFVMWIIIFVIIKNMLDIFFILDKWVNLFVAFGLTIVAAQLKLTYYLSYIMLQVVSILGVTSVWVLLFMFFVAMILLAFGSTFFHRWIIGLRIAREGANVKQGAGEVAQGIRALKEVRDSFK